MHTASFPAEANNEVFASQEGLRSHHPRGEGPFDYNPPPLEESRSKNYLTMSMEDISEGMLTYDYVK